MKLGDTYMYTAIHVHTHTRVYKDNDISVA